MFDTTRTSSDGCGPSNCGSRNFINFSILCHFLFNLYCTSTIHNVEFIHFGPDAESRGKLHFLKQSNLAILGIKRYIQRKVGPVM